MKCGPKIEKGQRMASEGIDLIVKIQPLIKLMPDLLGVSDVKRYLVLFQNDAELRATGGFITAYAVFGIDKGSIGVEQSEDIYNPRRTTNKEYSRISRNIKVSRWCELCLSS